ncbi:23S rRNA (adenine(2503)-C(2))-methyltransferase RlmN [Acidobacteriia bacterium AH_259_A11_L15]|nr:23S rRNA (adenine(2503)-C(2))-methyltransferase RlmN [Acidobacteriia bacterium AH_259_A11_L15]
MTPPRPISNPHVWHRIKTSEVGLVPAMPIELLGFELEEFRRLAQQWGEPAYRGSQLYHALYAEGRREFSRMTSLSRALRARLERDAAATWPQLARRYPSADGSIRYLLQLGDGKTIETVWMPEKNRQTLCLSTQAGCAVDCRFCATARLGLVRNLSAGEIVGQVLAVLADNRQRRRPRTNVVLMGQGEPLLNYEPTLKAVRLLADPQGMNIPLLRITLSTSGIIPGIRRLAREDRRPKLGVSLNATTDEQRTAIMPLNRKYPLGELFAACRAYPLRPRERLTFEYVLLGGFNDTPEDARRLARLTRGLRCKVNLIPWNPVPGLPYRAPADAALEPFQKILRRAGLLAFLRCSRGQDVSAACGQLASLTTPSPQPSPASAG